MTLVDLLAGIRELMQFANDRAKDLVMPKHSRARRPWDVEDFNLPQVISAGKNRDGYSKQFAALEFRVKHVSGKIFVVSVREER